MTFQDDFPSLTEEIADGICPECDNACWCETKIKKHCIDKEKIKEIFYNSLIEIDKKLDFVIAKHQRTDELCYNYAKIMGITIIEARKKLGL